MAFSLNLSSSVSHIPNTPQTHHHQRQQHGTHVVLQIQSLQFPTLLQASRRTSNFPQDSDSLMHEHQNWSRNQSILDREYKDNDDEDDDDDDEEDRSLDLLVRFVENVFKKVSRRARKAVQSVLPVAISTKLVAFSVNGVIMLAFLWVLKAFLEVLCTLGSAVFVSILLIRGIWSGVSYLQESRNHKVNKLDDEHQAWAGAQPVT